MASSAGTSLQLVKAADVKKHVLTLNYLAQNKYYLEKITERDRIE